MEIEKEINNLKFEIQEIWGAIESISNDLNSKKETNPLNVLLDKVLTTDNVKKLQDLTAKNLDKALDDD